MLIQPAYPASPAGSSGSSISQKGKLGPREGKGYLPKDTADCGVVGGGSRLELGFSDLICPLLSIKFDLININWVLPICWILGTLGHSHESA